MKEFSTYFLDKNEADENTIEVNIPLSVIKN